MRRRFIQDPRTGDLVPAEEFVPESSAPVVWADLPAYESPVTGLIVEGRAARREDLRRTGSRPWEGIEAEKKEAARVTAQREAQQDRKLHDAAARAFYGLRESERRLFKQ